MTELKPQLPDMHFTVEVQEHLLNVAHVVLLAQDVVKAFIF